MTPSDIVKASAREPDIPLQRKVKKTETKSGKEGEAGRRSLSNDYSSTTSLIKLN
jgi:hypothetical protein